MPDAPSQLAMHALPTNGCGVLFDIKGVTFNQKDEANAPSGDVN
jgi:hypothetical protein